MQADSQATNASAEQKSGRAFRTCRSLFGSPSFVFAGVSAAFLSSVGHRCRSVGSRSWHRLWGCRRSCSRRELAISAALVAGAGFGLTFRLGNRREAAACVVVPVTAAAAALLPQHFSSSLGLWPQPWPSPLRAARPLPWLPWDESGGSTRLSVASSLRSRSRPPNRSSVASSNSVFILIASNGQTSTQIWQLMHTEISISNFAG